MDAYGNVLFAAGTVVYAATALGALARLRDPTPPAERDDPQVARVLEEEENEP